jgi:hypothetical protein
MTITPGAGGTARPASVVRANQPITSRPQPVSSNGGQPAYRNEVKNNTPGNLPPQTRSEPQQPTQQQAKPYEWDVNRSQPQTVRPAEITPAPQPVQNNRAAPAPQQNYSRPAPAPQQNVIRQQAPQQNYNRPAQAPQQNISRPAPVPSYSRPSAPSAGSGGRR